MPVHLWGLSIGIHHRKEDPKAESEKVIGSGVSAVPYNKASSLHHRPSPPESGDLTTSSSSHRSRGNDEWSASGGPALDRRRRIRQRTHHTADEESQLNNPAVASVTAPSSAEGTHPRKRAANPPHRPASSALPSLLLRPSSPTSQKWYWVVLRNCLDAENWQKAWTWAKTHRRIVYCILFSIPFILRPSRLWKWRYSYFGKHNIHGGELGQRIEKWGNLQRYHEVQAQQNELLHSLGIELPPGTPPDASFRVLKLETQAALRELLLHRERRAKTLASLERQASLNVTCDETSCEIPRVIFVPDGFAGWYAPRPGKSKEFQQLSFDEREMRQFLMDTWPGLLPLFDDSSGGGNNLHRLHVWAVCAIYYFGGFFVGGGLPPTALETQREEALLWSKSSPIVGGTGHPFAAAVLGSTNQQIQILAATPRHPALSCALTRWEQMVKVKHLDTLVAEGAGVKQYDQLVADLFPGLEQGHVGWTEGILKERPSARDSSSRLCDFSVHRVKSLVRPSGPSYQARFVVEQIADSEAHLPVEQNFDVRISEVGSLDAPDRSAKVTLESQLREQGLEPGWFCMRCVKIPQYGQMERCTRFCPSGYTDLICRGPDMPPKKQIPVNVVVRGALGDYRSGTAIPKVIHQTWFEDVSPDRYPQLARLQNSWKNTGWRYQLFTDATARSYIVDHFPSRFVDAFDALIPGAFKADLFRYLILMREGGIYADVDVMLETNLDRFITPSLSFFAPRDVVAEFAGEPFCLWNGLIGAAPGHPFIVRAVERLVNLILDRADVFDMERDLCRDGNEPLDVWKVRLQTLLLLSGPCGLGVAVNEAQGNPSLQKIDTGWMGLEELEFGGKKDHGDALIMVVDKHDIGGFRMSDPERSTIVASTDMGGVEKHARELSNPMEAERKRQQQRDQKELTHYSNSNKGIFVWGSAGVYSDDMVTSERIKFTTQYQQVPVLS